MINKEKNINIKITLPIPQFKWIDSQAKKCKINKSKFISWLIAKKAIEMAEYCKLRENKVSQEELEELIRIVKTPWIK